MADWDAMLPSIVFTRLKNEFSNELKTKYNMTNSNFSTVGSSNTPAVFPFVHIKEIESPEIGTTLEGQNTNGIRYGLQIDVTDNKSQSNAKAVADETKRVMKKIGFKCKHPIPSSVTGNTYRYSFECVRPTGDEDIL